MEIKSWDNQIREEENRWIKLKLGNLCIDERKRKGYTQKQLSEKLEISDKTISKRERGMFMIGDVNPDMQKLVQVTKECMEIGIAAAQPWKQLGDVGAAIQEHAEKNGFSVVRDLCGHGVGMQFHEEPDVEHFGRRGTGMMIVPGMTFTIEPMINMGTYEVFVDDADGWTVCTDDGLPSAQWENMILITETGNEILTY